MKTNRLRAFGSTALSTTALLASHSDAATVVDVNGTSYNTGLAGIGTIGRSGNGGIYQGASVTTSATIMMASEFLHFRRGNDGGPVEFSIYTTNGFQYSYKNFQGHQARNGAVLNSGDNWLYAKSNVDPDQQVWLQFQFGSLGNGTDFSILKAVFPDSPGQLNTALAASTAVPEPSALALLSLGASGMLIRRRKQAT